MQLKAFIVRVKEDQSILVRLKAAKSPVDVVGIAKEYDHELAADNVSKLSEEDLEVVTGDACDLCLLESNST